MADLLMPMLCCPQQPHAGVRAFVNQGMDGSQLIGPCEVDGKDQGGLSLLVHSIHRSSGLRGVENRGSGSAGGENSRGDG